MESSTEVVRVPLPGPEIAEAAQAFLAQARSYQITSAELYEAAADDLREIKRRAKDLDEQRRSITKPLDDAKKRVMDLFRRPLEFLEQAETIIKRAMLTYDLEQERKRREEEAARRRALEEEQRRLAEEAARAEAERKRLEAEAEAKRQAGSHDEAEQLEREAQTRQVESESARAVAAAMPATIIEPEAAKHTGISYQERWSGEVVSLMDLVKAVAAGHVPLAALQADAKVLNEQARSLKAEFKWPGCRAVCEKVLAARAA